MREKEYLSELSKLDLPVIQSQPESAPRIKLENFNLNTNLEDVYLAPCDSPITSDFVTDLYMLWVRGRAEESSMYMRTLTGAALFTSAFGKL